MPRKMLRETGSTSNGSNISRLATFLACARKTVVKLNNQMFEVFALLLLRYKKMILRIFLASSLIFLGSCAALDSHELPQAYLLVDGKLTKYTLAKVAE